MNKKGFTLVELLAVIALLGILVLLIGPRVLDKYNDAQKGILLDEAKNIYTEATNKYLQERTNGKRITQIYSSMDGSEGINELDLVGEDVNYTIRLDKDGNVTALKVDNKRYCVEGIGEFLENATINDVLSLQDNPSACQRVDLMENERVRFRLLAKNPDLRDVNPKTLYLKYKKEWLNEEGKKITTITETPKMSNYIYNGFYYTDDEGAKTMIIDSAGKIVGPTDVIRKSTDEGVTASAEYYKKYYTVTYNGNTSTSGSMAPTKHEYLETTALAQNAFSKVGYTYQNWNTVANGSGETYTNKQSMPVISEETENDSAFKHGYNLNLYAIWKANQYTITFDPAGGTVSQTTKTVTYDQQFGTLPTPTKTGYSFAGWYNGSSKIETTTTVKITSNTTITAHWNENVYTITLDQNGGIGGTTTLYEKYNTNYSLTSGGATVTSITVPTRAGYTFNGYYTASSGGTQLINASGSFTTNFKTTLYASNSSIYAQWEACPKGKYCPGNNTAVACVAGSYQDTTGQTTCKACAAGKTSSAGATASSSCTDCSNKANISSWKTSSWNTNNTMTNLCAINACATGYNLSSNTCTPKIITVTLNRNGGSGGTATLYEKYNTNYSLTSGGAAVTKITVPTRAEYTFNGYYTASSGGTQLINASGAFTANFKTTLFTANSSIYAQWIQNSPASLADGAITGWMVAQNDTGGDNSDWIGIAKNGNYTLIIRRNAWIPDIFDHYCNYESGKKNGSSPWSCSRSDWKSYSNSYIHILENNSYKNYFSGSKLKSAAASNNAISHDTNNNAVPSSYDISAPTGMATSSNNIWFSISKTEYNAYCGNGGGATDIAKKNYSYLNIGWNDVTWSRTRYSLDGANIYRGGDGMGGAVTECCNAGNSFFIRPLMWVKTDMLKWTKLY